MNLSQNTSAIGAFLASLVARAQWRRAIEIPLASRKRTGSLVRHGLALYAVAVCALSAGVQAQPIFGVIDGPIDMLADVTQAFTPSGIVFSDNQVVRGSIAGPKQTAQFVHLVPGSNLSGRSLDIRSGFASALAESDGNGGVGVSQVLFGPLPNAQSADLVSQAVWTQTFVHAGRGPADISLHLEIPPIELGLFGFAPARTRPSTTETAQATATIFTTIKRADGSTSSGFSFERGMEVHEVQFPRGALFSNEAVAFGVGDTDDSQIERGELSSFQPIFTLPAFSGDVLLGTLNLGDELTYIYSLQARGTTNGSERGYHAFIGDPFGVDIVGGNLRSTVTLATPVPEPGSWLLALAGWVSILGYRHWRRRDPLALPLGQTQRKFGSDGRAAGTP